MELKEEPIDEGSVLKPPTESNIKEVEDDDDEVIIIN